MMVGYSSLTFLEDKPYTKVKDLAVVYQILMDKNAEGTATITITDNLMDRYGITLEDLHEQALQNMDILQPYSFKGMSETIIEMMAGDIARDNDMDISEAREMASRMIPDVPDTMFVLTNDAKLNGAAAILNDDIRQKIADKVGDFYVQNITMAEKAANVGLAKGVKQYADAPAGRVSLKAKLEAMKVKVAGGDAEKSMQQKVKDKAETL